MQATGRPWDEVTLLRMALVAEGLVERKAPKVHYKILCETVNKAKFTGDEPKWPNCKKIYKHTCACGTVQAKYTKDKR